MEKEAFPKGFKIVEKSTSIPDVHSPYLKSQNFTSPFIKSAHNHSQRKHIMNKKIEGKEAKSFNNLPKLTFLSSRERASITNWVLMKHP